MTKSEINELLSTGQWKAVLKILLHITQRDNDLNNQIKVISFNLNELDKKRRINQLDTDRIDQAKSQAIYSLFEYIDMIWEDDAEDKDIPETLIPKGEPTLSSKNPIQEHASSLPEVPRTNVWKPNTLLLALVIIAGVAVIAWLVVRQSSSSPDAPSTKTQSIMVSLYGEGGLQDKPLTAGILKMESLESIFKDQASIGPDGNAIFDSVPLGLIGKKVFFSLEVDKKFQLAEPQNEYLLAERVNVKLKEKKEIKPPTPIGESFKGDWKNINDASNGISFLEISRANPSAPLSLRVRSKCCTLTIASPRNIANNRITLDDFDFGTNHYSNFVVEKLSINSLVCTCLVRLGDGREFQIRDTLRKQLQIQSGQ